MTSVGWSSETDLVVCCLYLCLVEIKALSTTEFSFSLLLEGVDGTPSIHFRKCHSIVACCENRTDHMSFLHLVHPCFQVHKNARKQTKPNKPNTKHAHKNNNKQANTAHDKAKNHRYENSSKQEKRQSLFERGKSSDLGFCKVLQPIWRQVGPRARELLRKRRRDDGAQLSQVWTTMVSSRANTARVEPRWRYVEPKRRQLGTK